MDDFEKQMIRSAKFIPVKPKSNVSTIRHISGKKVMKLENLLAMFDGCRVNFSKTNNKIYMSNNKEEKIVDLNNVIIEL
jgi:hypothetical protein